MLEQVIELRVGRMHRLLNERRLMEMKTSVFSEPKVHTVHRVDEKKKLIIPLQAPLMWWETCPITFYSSFYLFGVYRVHFLSFQVNITCVNLIHREWREIGITLSTLWRWWLHTCTHSRTQTDSHPHGNDSGCMSLVNRHLRHHKNRNPFKCLLWLIHYWPHSNNIITTNHVASLVWFS